jgi:ribosomal protein L29
MSTGRTFEQRRAAKADELRDQSDDQLKLIIYTMQMEIASSHGMLARRGNTAGAAMKLTSTNDPRNNFRKKIIARCLTILNERGVKRR